MSDSEKTRKTEHVDKREVLRGLYSGEAWQQKVSRMSHDQVVAIYLRLKSQNKI